MWEVYQVSFRLLAPLHIGWRKVGNLQQTRFYLTGRNLWGALTARIARDNGRGDYGETGAAMDEQLAFSYFYPSTDTNKVAVWPWGGTTEEFIWRFVGSYASTALQDGRSSEEGSLHETEFIAPRTRYDEPVYLVGHIFEREGCSLRWQSVLDKLQFGGERTYGWGRVAQARAPTRVRGCFGNLVSLNEERPLLILSKGRFLSAHAVTDHLQCEGVIEPVVGRETASDGRFGQNFSDPQICWVPGSRVTDSVTLAIGEFGLLRQLV
jgi:hypothetical protein